MKKLYIVIDNIRSAYNVGSIFRTADGAGSCEIMICGISPTPDHPKVEKTALGSIKDVKWSYFKTAKEAVQKLKNSDIPVFSAEITEKSIRYSKQKYPEIAALVLGHETEGVSREILDMSDYHIFVPMKGKKESLNVATAAGILIYEILREKD